MSRNKKSRTRKYPNRRAKQATRQKDHVTGALHFEQLEVRRVLAGGPWESIADQITVDTGNPDNLIYVQQELATSLATLDAGVPVAGQSFDEMTSGLNFVGDAANALDTSLRNIDNVSEVTALIVQNEIFSGLGPNGLDLLGDRDGNGLVQPDDIEVTVGDDISVRLDLYRELELQNQFFSIELPGVPFTLDSATVQTDLIFEYKDLSFGISEDQVFLDTNGEDELSFTVHSMMTQSNISGQLSFLEILASETDTPTQFQGTLAVDLTGSLQAGLGLADPVLNGAANVYLDVGVYLSTSQSSDGGLVPCIGNGFPTGLEFCK